MAVVISGTSGTWTHGQSVTISGSGFGTRADNGGAQSFMCAAYHDFQSAINGGNFAMDGANNASFSLNSAVARPNHANCLQKVFNGNELGAYSYVNTQSPNTWFTSFWFRMPTNTQAGKFWRMWGSPQSDNIYLSSGGDNTYIRGFSESTSISPPPQTEWGGPPAIGFDVWSRVDIIAEDYPASSFRAYVNNVLSFEKTNWVPTPWATSGHTLDVPDMLDDPSRDGQGWFGYYQFSDIYFDYTVARVEIGNASTWSASTHREVQIPMSWADSSVGIRVQQGSFAAGAAYLYVVDSTGAVNTNGYPITIGSGSTVIVPVANFTATPLTGQAPLLVNFTDSSTNTPTSWAWNFGANSSPATSILQNPSTTYAYGGAKTVSLTATNSAGSDGETKTNYVTARYLKPTNFGAN